MARARFKELVEASGEMHAVKTLLSRFNAAVRQRTARRIAVVYVDPAMDRQFYRKILLDGQRFRFRIANPTIRGETAHALVTEFSYLDGNRGQRVSVSGLRILMRKAKGHWKIVDMRREQR